MRRAALDVMLVIDMQKRLLKGDPRRDTMGDRPHLPAERVIEHHHWIWTNLIASRPVHVVHAAEIEPGA